MQILMWVGIRYLIPFPKGTVVIAIISSDRSCWNKAGQGCFLGLFLSLVNSWRVIMWMLMKTFDTLLAYFNLVLIYVVYDGIVFYNCYFIGRSAGYVYLWYVYLCIPGVCYERQLMKTSIVQVRANDMGSAYGFPRTLLAIGKLENRILCMTRQLSCIQYVQLDMYTGNGLLLETASSYYGFLLETASSYYDEDFWLLWYVYPLVCIPIFRVCYERQLMKISKQNIMYDSNMQIITVCLITVIFNVCWIIHLDSGELNRNYLDSD